MKGFGIYVKNDLIDPKHIAAMYSAVWLYLYLLDKMTSINENGVGKVLGSQPVTYEMVKMELGISRKKYWEWATVLRDAGYVNTLRTPQGLVYTVNKAEKVFARRTRKASPQQVRDVSEQKQQSASDVSESVHHSLSDVSLLERDVPKSEHLIYKNKTIQDNTTITNVIGTSFGDPQINKIVEHFESKMGKMPRATNQRRAAKTLLQRHGFEKVIGAINAVEQSRGDRYAPVISNLEALRDRWIDLETYWRKHFKPRGVNIE